MDDTTLVSRFLRDGFVKLEGAVAPRVAADRVRLLWRETGCDPDDPATWTQPVHWVAGMAQGPFAAAPNSPFLQHAYDLLVGAGRTGLSAGWRRACGTMAGSAGSPDAASAATVVLYEASRRRRGHTA
ncbi:hypothetical protein GCM10022252_74130 [Streptosporangium oxazolinicum]|uniref:Uncharacterized protein n=1 Tax=Streptosporangium oxazolinicum TaxID=909287 RepID=A0ABP8BJU8_9ACTN